ncbi:MAG: hypothetical protein NXY59_09135 [Aigarchaeota archaeon]|nr:hypothetical protein [Candidatus Pelearchaeum maunauluense]
MRIVIGAERSLGFWDPYYEEQRKRRMEPCVVCGLELGEQTIYSCPHCSATGHESCFDDWLRIRNACPLCRRPILEEVG